MFTVSTRAPVRINSNSEEVDKKRRKETKPLPVGVDTRRKLSKRISTSIHINIFSVGAVSPGSADRTALEPHSNRARTASTDGIQRRPIVNKFSIVIVSIMSYCGFKEGRGGEEEEEEGGID